MKLKFKKVDASDLVKCKRLFYQAFAKTLPHWYLKLKAKKNFIDYLAIYHDDTYVGFIYLIHQKQLTHVLFFAIDPSHRGKGYGSFALDLLRKTYKKQSIILNIQAIEDAPNKEERILRKAFYLKNAYVETKYMVSEFGDNYEMLSDGQVSFTMADYFNLLKRFASPFAFIIPIILKYKIRS